MCLEDGSVWGIYSPLATIIAWFFAILFLTILASSVVLHLPSPLREVNFCLSCLLAMCFVDKAIWWFVKERSSFGKLGIDWSDLRNAYLKCFYRGVVLIHIEDDLLNPPEFCLEAYTSNRRRCHTSIIRGFYPSALDTSYCLCLSFSWHSYLN